MIPRNVWWEGFSSTYAMDDVYLVGEKVLNFGEDLKKGKHAEQLG